MSVSVELDWMELDWRFLLFHDIRVNGGLLSRMKKKKDSQRDHSPRCASVALLFLLEF